MKTSLIIIALSTLSALANASSVPTLRCGGSEPFWGVRVDAKGFLSFTSNLSDTKRFYSKTSLKNAVGMADGYAFQVLAQDQAKNTLKLNVLKADCTDESDTTNPYTVLVDVDGIILSGCCK